MNLYDFLLHIQEKKNLKTTEFIEVSGISNGVYYQIKNGKKTDLKPIQLGALKEKFPDIDFDILENKSVKNSNCNKNNSYISVTKEGVEVTLEEVLAHAIQNPGAISLNAKKMIAYIVAVDEDHYFEQSTLANSFELRVLKRLRELLREEKNQ